MTTALKLGIGTTLGVGAIGGAIGIGYAVNNSDSSKPKTLTIKEEFSNEGVQILNTSKEAGNSDDTSWGKLATEHAKEQTAIANKVKKISNLDIKAHSGNTVNPGINQLKIRCDNLLAKNKKSEGYAQAKIDAKNWCSKSSSLLG